MDELEENVTEEVVSGVKGRIIPSVPFKNYEEIEVLAGKARQAGLKRIQIDFCDGKYVKSRTWPFNEFTQVDFEKLGQTDAVDVYLPLWENMNYTVDMMCEEPERYIDSLVAYGVDEVIVHYRSLKGNSNTFDKIVDKCKNYELKLYLAADLKVDLEDFVEFSSKYISDLEGFQVMGIENIGFQGQEFAVGSLELVKKIKGEFPDKVMLFDGAINQETIISILESGVDILCVGSYLTSSESFEESLSQIKEILHEQTIL